MNESLERLLLPCKPKVRYAATLWVSSRQQVWTPMHRAARKDRQAHSDHSSDLSSSVLYPIGASL